MSDVSQPRSLTRQTLWKVALRIGIVVAVATVMSYYHVRTNLERQTIEQFEKYVQERRARESSAFLLATHNLDTLSKEFLKEYEQSVAEIGSIGPRFRFSEIFERRPDGTTRVRERAFLEKGITGFIGKHVEITDDLRRRLIIAFDMLARYGPAWRSQFGNLYVITPENAVLMFWPELPWALEASDWEIFGKLALIAGSEDDVLVVEPKAMPAEEGPNWSHLYFDYGINDWMVSVTKPIVLAERTLLSVGHDILLNDLFQRVMTNKLPGTYSMIFTDDGRLIVHPQFMDAIQARSGRLTIPETENTHLGRIYDLATNSPNNGVISDNAVDSEVIAITRIYGPEWYLVSAFPQEIIAERAFKTARLILLLGAVALFLEIGILYFVLKRQVAEPLKELVDATHRIASRRFDDSLTIDRRDEIGELAQSFNVMAREINSREEALRERSERLAELNTRLERELRERERAEREIARQREALHQSEKLKALGSMLAGVAHELNNPLSIVVGRTFLLEENLRDSRHAADVGKVRAAAERCAKIVKTFLAMARKQDPSYERVNIAAVIDAAIDLVDYGLTTADVTIVKDVPADLPQVLADPGQLGQVFSNLFLNAQQAMAEQTGRRSIRVLAAHDRQTSAISISISDTGPGIPPALRSRVFDPYFTTKPAGVGTGIGLSVCFGIIEAHKGTIAVTDDDGPGATFVITLPVAAGE